MKVILIIMLWYGNGVGVASVEFDDLAACNEARKTVEAAWGVANRVVCVPKGTR